MHASIWPILIKRRNTGGKEDYINRRKLRWVITHLFCFFGGGAAGTFKFLRFTTLNVKVKKALEPQSYSVLLS